MQICVKNFTLSFPEIGRVHGDLKVYYLMINCAFTLFSVYLDGKQCRDSFQQAHSCDPSSVLCFVAFQSSFICRLLLDLDSYGGNDPDGMVPLFYKQMNQELVPKMTVIFRHLVKGSRFPACWMSTDVVHVPKRSHSSDAGDYRPISITSILSKEFEKIVSGN